MIASRGQKIDLLKWANDQNQLERTTKSTLKELAGYADADCCSWAKISTLAYGVNCSERTVQYQLRALQEAGLIRDTGRLHRLEGSTRSVPIYQLAPSVEGLGKPERMGAEIAPIEGDGCNPAGGMGAIGLHPQETIGTKELADASSPGACARTDVLDEVFDQLVEAVPARMLKFSDLGAARLELAALAERGTDVRQLPDCAIRMADDPDFKSRKFPPTLEDWIAKGQWRGYPAAAAVAREAEIASPVSASAKYAAGDADQAVWRVVAERLIDALTEKTFGSWVRPAVLAAHGERLFIVALNGTARDWIRNNCWRRVEAWWAEADTAARPLGLVSKAEFEALLQREGVG